MLLEYSQAHKGYVDTHLSSLTPFIKLLGGKCDQECPQK